MLVHVGFEGLGAFVVKALELRLHSSFAEAGMQSLVGVQETLGGLVFEGLPKDAVAIVVIEYH